MVVNAAGPMITKAKATILSFSGSWPDLDSIMQMLFTFMNPMEHSKQIVELMMHKEQFCIEQSEEIVVLRLIEFFLKYCPQQRKLVDYYIL